MFRALWGFGLYGVSGLVLGLSGFTMGAGRV